MQMSFGVGPGVVYEKPRGKESKNGFESHCSQVNLSLSRGEGVTWCLWLEIRSQRVKGRRKMRCRTPWSVS